MTWQGAQVEAMRSGGKEVEDVGAGIGRDERKGWGLQKSGIQIN